MEFYIATKEVKEKTERITMDLPILAGDGTDEDRRKSC